MDSSEYELTIKSANQKVDDYVTKCCSNWNVKRLKQHISETHINKPSIEDQRLIYSGNLLKDHEILEEIFSRDPLTNSDLTNSNKKDFTIHLVCWQQKIVNNNGNTYRAISISSEEDDAKRRLDIIEQQRGEPELNQKRTTAELTISINKAPSSSYTFRRDSRTEEDDNNMKNSSLLNKQEPGEIRSHYRTRQIGSYYGQQQQQEQAKTSSSSTSSSSSSSSSSSTSSTSKIAKRSITTNRKQTTSTISEESSLLKTNKGLAAKTAAAIETAASEEQKKSSTATLLSNKMTDTFSSNNNDNSSLISRSLSSSKIVRPSPLEGLLLKDKYKNNDLFDIEPTTTKSIQVEEEEESSIHHRESFSSTTSLKRATGGSVLLDGSKLRKAAAANAAATVSSLSASSSATSEASSSSARHATTVLNSNNNMHQDHHLSTSSSSSSSRHFKTSSSSVQLLSAAAGGGLNTENQLALTTANNNNNGDNNNFLTTDSLFSSPDVRSLVREITTDFAELENALSSTTRSLSNSKLSGSANSSHSGICSLSSRLFGRRLLSPIESENNNYTKAISNSSSGHNLFDEHSTIALPAALKANETTDTTTRYNNNNNRDQDSSFDSRSNTDKINDLLAKAGSFNSSSSSSTLTKSFSSTPTTQLSYYPIKKDNSNSSNLLNSENNHQTIISEIKRPSSLLLTNENKIGVTVSIERIDQKMSDLCKKFNECNDTKEAIDLLKIMIQMIEKAWSVPVCGDDLGFKLCNSLRIAGGLDIILGFIQDADNLPTMTTNDYENQSMIHDDKQSISESPLFTQTSNKATLNNQEAQLLVAKSSTNSSSPLRLNLSKLNRQQSVQSVPNSPTTLANLPSSTSDNNNYSIKASSNSKTRYAIKDSDSDAITSDLGLDSTSVESLSYVSASASASGQVHQSNSIENTEQTNKKNIDETTTMTPSENKTTTDTDDGNQCEEEKPEDLSGNFDCQEDNNLVEEELAEIKIGESELNEEEVNLRKEELVFLSAKLLSQCLTLDNRDYIVDNGLNPVIKLACNFTTMKSSQSQKLLSRSMIMRQSSSIKSKQIHSKKNSPSEEPTEKITQINDNDNVIQNTNTLNNNNSKTVNSKTLNSSKFKFNNNSNYSQYYNNKNELTENNNNDSDHSVVHAIIGTEILQHLFKHSEDTCSKMISLGALQAILYACRSSNIETLRHCASALANLALYGGPEIQQTMIEEQAHHWLFPLAFNEDDNVQYYACLAIVVLAANQEIEADVQKSGTLDLVEPFVTLHEPQKFAESTTAHIHGQSANWLRKLIPLLESKRQEARSLACFHFAMEAYIKKEQGQTKVFNDIGAVEILKKVGCSPIAIISKFSCQALRLIGEKEPHRLSQHVPKWTCEDVIVWVSQIGFVDKYNDAFLNSHVDGDLLLQLDEDMLRLDIGIENGIIRKKFLRELSKLKQIADYSSVDKSNLSSLLKTNVGNEFVQYIYLMLQLGVTRDNIHWLDIEKLINECKISNTIHQLKLAQAIKDLQEKLAAQVEEDEASELLLDKNGIIGNNCSDYHGHHLQKKTLDVFISYRRSTGSQLASLLKVHLQLRGFSVFIDVERLEAGKFDNNLLDSIKSAKNFILVLSPNALDRCIGDHDCKDWVHKEIVAALASNCNIIPIMDNFHWPDADQLPEDMRSITYFNGVRWIHDYQDACVDKVERFIRGELMNNYFLTNNNNSLTTFNSSAPSSLQRSTATPAIITGAAGVGLSAAPSTATPSTATFPPLTPRIPAPPFDSDHHPLSFASSNHNSYYHNNHHHHHNNNNNHHQQQHYQHSQSAPNTITNMTHSNATHPPVLIRR